MATAAPFATLAIGGPRGAGCTTVASSLADALARSGLRVAAFDLDPHGAMRCSPRVQVVRLGDQPATLACDLAILDAGGEATQEPLAEADEVLVVLRPGDSPAPFEAMFASRRPPWRRRPARYLINQLDARRQEDRAALAALRATLQGRLLACTVQHDAAFGAPGSQSAADIERLCAAVAPPHARRADARAD